MHQAGLHYTEIYGNSILKTSGITQEMAQEKAWRDIKYMQFYPRGISDGQHLWFGLNFVITFQFPTKG